MAGFSIPIPRKRSTGVFQPLSGLGQTVKKNLLQPAPVKPNDTQNDLFRLMRFFPSGGGFLPTTASVQRGSLEGLGFSKFLEEQRNLQAEIDIMNNDLFRHEPQAGMFGGLRGLARSLFTF